MSHSRKTHLPQAGRPGARRAPGFVLLPVVLALTLIAAVALLMTYEGTLNTHLVAGQTEAFQARYLAEAGLAHAKWQLAQKTTCSGYTNLPATAFNSHSYSAVLSANSGSPLSITATGTHASGITRTLTAAVRVFQPPTSLTLQPDPTEGKDGWVTSNQPTDNYGSTDEMTISGGAQQKHFLIQFDLTAIPPDATIESVRLEMYLNTSSGDPAAKFIVYRMTNAWAEGTGDYWDPGDGANWNTADGSTAWNWASNHDAANPMAVTPVNPSFTGWHAWDITRLVQQWAAGVAPNHGLVIKGNANTVNAWFYSSDWNTAAQRPKLTLTYACECGAVCGAGAGPIAHWKLDDGTGATAADSADGHDGTLTNGPTWDSGQLDGALNFDGNDDYVNVPHDDTLSLTTFSISAWIRATALSGWQIVVNKGTTTSAVNYYLGTNGDEIGLGFYNAGWVEFNATSADLSTDTWYHVAATFDDSIGEGKVYLDGTLVHTSTTTKSPLPNSDALTIGRSGFGEHWPGMLDDVRIYDRVLGAPEVAMLAGGGGGGGCAGTLRDEFNAVSYEGSDGTLSWTGPWTEIGESDGPSAGDVRVMNDQSNYQLRVGSKDNGLERQADLSGYATATLEFEYRREHLDKNQEDVQIEISDNGGSSWTELGQVSNGADSDYQSMSYDISDYIAANTRIRFVTSSKVDADDIVYFDNLEICVGN